jgi:hypothetical protein
MVKNRVIGAGRQSAIVPPKRDVCSSEQRIASTGRVLYFDCGTYVQADRMGYDHWLLVR